MYLEKLEIQGFKSFARKNVLVFPGMLDQTRRGLTAIVGPNGSGKSNVADAVRWAIGEQSMKVLRGKRSEDVIFSGSDKKGRLGMCEVSLYLNNEDKQAPIDYSEIVITRRLYRDGDSEYILNNSRVRLADIQMLLARSHFGQKTYSVIGQGMVEGFLNTSLAERKEFFDEATGVKQYQIKRDDSLNKLRATYENLNQASLLITEIEPRLRSLTRQVNKLRRRSEIEAELKKEQGAYYAALWHDIHGHFTRYNEEFLKEEKQKLERDRKLENLVRELKELEAESGAMKGLGDLQSELGRAQADKDELTRKIARLEAEREIRLERSGQFDLSWIMGKKDELERELRALDEEIATLEHNIAPERENLARLAGEKSALEKKIAALNADLASARNLLSPEDLSGIERRAKSAISELERAGGEEEPGALKKIIAAARKFLEEILATAGKRTAAVDQAKLHADLLAASADKDALLLKTSETSLRITARSERIKLLNEKKRSVAAELAGLEAKLKTNGQGNGGEDNELERQKNGLRSAEGRIGEIKEKISALSSREEAKRSRLFDIQRRLQATQEEINGLNLKLNELKINSTRYETKLEDLEIEIREQYGDLKAVREREPAADLDLAAARENIDGFKRQLEAICGLDPEVEKEYEETKNRFDFLSGQVADLTDTIGSLEKIISELDLTIKERFDKEFGLIAKKFEEYFKILFNGGAAKIIKVMENEAAAAAEGEAPPGGEAEAPAAAPAAGRELFDLKKIKFLQKHNATGLAGIEIQATPPGKKIRSIAMLSGGERAMTAIALICAIISSNPSPFVVLDEVDAALDEANSERLAKILDDLSHKTQFIVITHNRASMRRANILYGVTMGDDGVSKLLSVKLDEAAAAVE